MNGCHCPNVRTAGYSSLRLLLSAAVIRGLHTVGNFAASRKNNMDEDLGTIFSAGVIQVLALPIATRSQGIRPCDCDQVIGVTSGRNTQYFSGQIGLASHRNLNKS